MLRICLSSIGVKMALKDKIQEEIAKILAIGLLALVAFALAAIWVLPDAMKPTKLITWLDKYATGQNLLQLWIAIGGLVAWIIYLHPWLSFDQHRGIYRNVITGTFYCTRCKAKKVTTPLQVRDKGWYCASCPWSYKDPDYKEPPQQTMQRQKNWVKGY